MDAGEAIVTNRKPRNLEQRGTAEAAIGGKKREKDAGSSAFCPAKDRGGRCCGLGRTYSKPSTAEDCLLLPARLRAAAGKTTLKLRV